MRAMSRPPRPASSGPPHLWAPCTLALLLAACGGGGGAGDTAAPAPVPVSFTSQTQTALAADALQSASDFSLGMMGALLLRSGLSLVSLAPCTFGGTMSITGHVTSPTQVATGDTLTLSAVQCIELQDGVLTTTDGTLTATAVSGGYDSANVVYPATLSIAVVAQAFSVSSSAGTSAFHGDMRLDLTEASPTVASYVFTGRSIRNTYASGGKTHWSALSNYRMAVGVDGPISTEETTGHVETESRWLGLVAYDLATPVQLVESAGVMSSGRVRLAGPGWAMLVNLTGDDTYWLQFDGDGDGWFESESGATEADMVSYL